MNAAEYQRRWAWRSNNRVVDTDVPADVQWVTEHEPCFMCGSARDLCRHRKAA